jgi:hypothetical protein
MDVLTVISGFFLAIILSELFLRKNKIHTSLVSIIIMHVVVFLVLYLLQPIINIKLNLIAVIIFWAGAFLAWFVVRSHLESSVLLQMIHLIGKHSDISKDNLCSLYESVYSPELRLKELIKGGLIENNPNKVIVSRKGHLIVSIITVIVCTWKKISPVQGNLNLPFFS